MAELVITILGCGSSGGVPRLGGHWGECDPDNPKNHRQRCSILVERQDGEGTTRVLIDTSPDMRAQLLAAGVGTLDAVFYTHEHADHTHGLDDLRMIVFNMRERLPVWANARTAEALRDRFGYAFEQPEWSTYPPILEMHLIDGPVEISGAGGTLRFDPFEVPHGGINALGFRFNDIVYLPDASDMPDEVWPRLEGLRCWILDALRRAPHPTHINLETALDWIAHSGAQQGVLTNMHIDLDYATVAAETPDHVLPAYDGLRLRFDI
ncbi:MBL fold metallo-hydrolase [Halovulum sp. GXIMD14793]